MLLSGCHCSGKVLRTELKFKEINVHFYPHELLFLLFPRADGIFNGLHLLQDGLGFMQFVAMRGTGHFVINSGERQRKNSQLAITVNHPYYFLMTLLNLGIRWTLGICLTVKESNVSVNNFFG